MSAFRQLWDLRRSRPIFLLASSLLVSFFLVYPFVDIWLRSIGLAPEFRMWDFGAYGGAFNRWQSGEIIYEQNAQGGYARKYLYPPITLLVFYPFIEFIPQVQTILSDLFTWMTLFSDVVQPLFGVLPRIYWTIFSFLFSGLGFLGAALDPLLTVQPKVYWAVFSLLFAWIGVQFAITALGLRLSWLERGLLLWAMFGFQPLLLSLKMGQMAAFQLGLLSLSLGALVRNGHRDAAYSGATTALVGILKPSYSYVGAHLLADRDRMVGALATGAGVLLASVLIFGIDPHVQYLDVLLWGIEKGNSARSPALWLVPYYKPITHLPHVLELRVLVAGLIVLGAILAVPDADLSVFALGVAAFPLFSPKTYTYYLTALLLAALVLLAVELDMDGKPTIPIVGLFFVSIHSPIGLAVTMDILPELLSMEQTLRPFYPMLQPGLWGNSILVGLAAVRVSQQLAWPQWLQPVYERVI